MTDPETDAATSREQQQEIARVQARTTRLRRMASVLLMGRGAKKLVKEAVTAKHASVESVDLAMSHMRKVKRRRTEMAAVHLRVSYLGKTGWGVAQALAKLKSKIKGGEPYKPDRRDSFFDGEKKHFFQENVTDRMKKAIGRNVEDIAIKATRGDEAKQAIVEKAAALMNHRLDVRAPGRQAHGR